MPCRRCSRSSALFRDDMAIGATSTRICTGPDGESHVGGRRIRLTDTGPSVGCRCLFLPWAFREEDTEPAQVGVGDLP